MSQFSISLTGQWTDAYLETGLEVGTPLLIYVDGGAMACSISASQPSNFDYGAEARQGEQISAGGGGSEKVWLRATSGGAAVVRVQDGNSWAARKIDWSDHRVLDGGKALTTQPLELHHAKVGREYTAGLYTDQFLAGGSLDVVMEVGTSWGVVLKAISASFNTGLISSQVFKSPQYSGGAAVPIYNLRDEIAVPEDVVVLSGPTVTDPGTAVGPKIYSIGTPQQGSKSSSSVSGEEKIERILEKGQAYLFRFTNENGDDGSLAADAVWYQGPLTTELP